MENKKKVIALVFMAALILPVLAACDLGNKTDDSTVAATNTFPEATTAVPEETTVEITAAEEASTAPGTSKAPEVTTTPEVTTLIPEESTAAHVHSYSTDWKSNGTNHWHECSCGVKINEAVHTYGDWVVTKEATETSTGERYHTCTVCGYKETGVIQKLDHVHVFASTWSSDGTNHWHACACGEKTDVSSHKFGSWTVTKTETCSAEGSQESICTVCGHKETQSIEKLAHTPVTDYGVAATCTVPGKTDGTHCAVCNTVITAQETIPALGHQYAETVYPPSKTEGGYTYHFCVRCNDNYKDTFTDATGSLGLAYKDNGDGTCIITGIGTCTDAEILTPKAIDGLTVVGFGDNAFGDQTQITSILFNDTIASIGTRAFYNTGISTITIPNTVKEIGAQVFYKCSSLSTVYYNSTFSPNKENGFLNTTSIKKIVFNGDCIPANICYSCGTLTEIVIKDNVKYVDGGAFYKCVSLSSISFEGSSLNRIYSSSFEGCSSLETVMLPEGLTDLGAYAFKGCAKLQNVGLPSTLVHCEDRPFVSSFKKENLYVSSLASLCNIAWDTEDYEGCVILANHLYLNGQLVTRVVLPDTVTRIPRRAFNTEDITEIVIPDSVVSIKADSLRWDKVTTIYYEGSIDNWSILYNGAGSPETTATIVCNYSGS